MYLYFYIFTDILFLLNPENHSDMKNKRTIRTYHLTDAALVVKANEKLAFMRRDSFYFAQYGINDGEFDLFAQEVENFSNWVTDIELKAKQMEITLAKKAKANEVIDAIEKLMHIVELKFKKGSAHYKAFGTDKLSLQNDSKLYLTAKQVVKMGLLYLSELTIHGLTLDHLNTLTDLNDAYLNLLLDQRISLSNRKNFNEERILLGNDIYAKLKRYTTLGLSIWNTESVAKYNDYLLYDEKK